MGFFGGFFWVGFFGWVFYCQPWLKAGAALAHLVTIHTRPDPLYNELQAGIKNSDEAAVRDTYIQVGKTVR